MYGLSPKEKYAYFELWALRRLYLRSSWCRRGRRSSCEPGWSRDRSEWRWPSNLVTDFDKGFEKYSLRVQRKLVVPRISAETIRLSRVLPPFWWPETEASFHSPSAWTSSEPRFWIPAWGWSIPEKTRIGILSTILKKKNSKKLIKVILLKVHIWMQKKVFSY